MSPRADATGADILAIAAEHIGERYALGARAPLTNPLWQGSWDCSEFASWCTYQAAGIIYGAEPRGDASRADAYTGYWAAQSRADDARCGVDHAARTVGAMLLRIPGSGGPKTLGHIAISDGAGGTIEAHSTARGVCRAEIAGRRWDCGVLVPGIRYREEGPMPTLTPPQPVLRLTRPMMRGEAVTAVQRALLARRIYGGPVDGLYGPITAAAVQRFQMAAGLVADGEVGPYTRAALRLP